MYLAKGPGGRLALNPSCPGPGPADPGNPSASSACAYGFYVKVKGGKQGDFKNAAMAIDEEGLPVDKKTKKGVMTAGSGSASTQASPSRSGDCTVMPGRPAPRADFERGVSN